MCVQLETPREMVHVGPRGLKGQSYEGDNEDGAWGRVLDDWHAPVSLG